MAGDGKLKQFKTFSNGFSLIEVMIVVVIIGILAAVVFPGYRQYVVQSNRTSATACLTEISQFMERTYTQNMTYAVDDIAIPAVGCVNDLSERYSFELSNVNRRTYTISAVPTSLQNDSECGSLTLNQAGQKGAAGGYQASTVKKCW